MSIFLHTVECPSCGGIASMCHNTKTYEIEYACECIQCEHYPDKEAQFLHRLKKGDFTTGDSFWLGDYKFECVETPWEAWYENVLRLETLEQRRVQGLIDEISPIGTECGL